MDKIEDPLGNMGHVLRELDVREIEAGRRLERLDAEREALEREVVQRRAVLDERMAAEQEAIADCRRNRDQAMALARALGHTAVARAEPMRTAAPLPTPRPVPAVPRKRGRPSKRSKGRLLDLDDDGDPGGPPSDGLERDEPPDDDELRGKDDL